MKTMIHNKMKCIYIIIADYKLLLRSVPPVVLTLFSISVILMNLLANKEIYLGVTWIALDCGFLISWIAFLFMDMLAKRFGPKAAFKISLFTIVCNLIVCGLMYMISLVPGNWGEYYTFFSDDINVALNNTIGGTWYILLGSTVAMVISSGCNSVINHIVSKLCKKVYGFKEYALRSYISTALAQFVDNMVFALIVSHTFFGWSMLQCIMCSITGCIVELVCEVVFSPLGYRICNNWEKSHVGSAYISAHRKGD